MAMTTNADPIARKALSLTLSVPLESLIIRWQPRSQKDSPVQSKRK